LDHRDFAPHHPPAGLSFKIIRNNYEDIFFAILFCADDAALGNPNFSDGSSRKPIALGWSLPNPLYSLYPPFFCYRTGQKASPLSGEYGLRIEKAPGHGRKGRLGAKKITLECPACQKKHTAWDYMKDKACPSCRSTLWSTAETDNPVDFQKVLKDWEKIQAFYDNTPAWALKSAREKVILDKA
jgi:hypothetical protein